MIDDLDATLTALLDDAAAPADLRAADVSFAAPDRDFKPTQPTLGLFLHGVVENRTLRDTGRPAALSGTAWSIGRPPLRVDCSYLVTAWSSQTAEQKVAAEHRLLGLALVWLARFPELPAAALVGALRTPPQPCLPPMVVAQEREERSSGLFWSALGISPRPAFSITVTVAVSPFSDVEQVPAVAEVHVTTARTDL